MNPPQHLRSRSRGQQSLESFKFPRSPPPPPSVPSFPAPWATTVRAPPPAPKFDFGARRGPMEQQQQEQRASWGGWRKRRIGVLWFCIVAVFCLGWVSMGGAERRRRVELREVEQVFAQGSSRRDAVDVPRQHRILEEPLPELASIRTEEESFSPSTSLPFILSAPASRLPKCDKIMLYTFKNWWGFGSEYLLYLRVSALATKLGYTLLEDDSKWNYGRLSNYFLPRQITCIPPTSWSNPKKAYPLGGPDWRSHPRIRYSRSILSTLDDWTREEYDLVSLASGLKEEEEEGRDILPMGESLPAAFENVFGDLEKETQGMWKLEEGLEREVGVLRERVGLGAEKWEVKREAEEDGKGWMGWNKLKRAEEGKGRGPVIGIHVRLGDKAPEYAHDAAESGIINTFGNLTVYASAAAEAYARLLPSSPHPLTTHSPLTFSPSAEPTLLLMTAEPGVLTSLAEEPLAKGFKVISTTSTTVGSGDAGDEVSEEEIKKRREEFEARVVGAYGRKDQGDGERRKGKRALSSSTPGLAAGYDQATFNSLPLVARVLHTRAFVRDLTLLAREADAFIVSASSNIGRLAMLLGGSDASIGPRSASGASLGGRIRSVDSYWYPTAYARAVWSKVVDKPDTNNKATVPIEWRKKKKGRKQVQGQRIQVDSEENAEQAEAWKKVTQSE